VNPSFNLKKSTEAGFTLVEIAIVLVIIGLLLGGILKGQEMITQPRSKRDQRFNGSPWPYLLSGPLPRPSRRRQNASARWTTQNPANGTGTA